MHIIVYITNMFKLKPTEIVRKIRKKNIGSFLAVVFCTLVIVSKLSRPEKNGLEQSFL